MNKEINKLFIIEDRWGVKTIYSSLPIEVVDIIDGDDLGPECAPLNVGVIDAHKQLVKAKENSNHVYVKAFDDKKMDWTMKPYGWDNDG